MISISISKWAAAALLVLPGVAGGLVLPSGIELERLADETYQPPGVPGEIFIIEQTGPVPCQGRVLFTGVTDVSVNTAIYAASSAGIEVVANLGTPIPGTPWTFTRAQRAACVGDRVFFAGGGGIADPAARGIFAWSSETGEIEQLLTSDLAFGQIQFLTFADVSPDVDAQLSGFAVTGPTAKLGHPARDALAFKSLGMAPPALLAEGYSTLLPGRSEPPRTLSEPLTRGLEVIFKASFPPLADSALYRWSASNGFALVADSTTIYPGIGSSLAGFGSLTDLDAGLVFSSAYAQGTGIFLARDDGSVVKLVAPGDFTADGDTLLEARFPSGGGGLLTFTGRTAANPLRPAIFVRKPDGEIRRILGIGDLIEGRQIGNVLSGADDRDVGIWTQSSTGGTLNVVIYRASFAGDALAVDVPSLSLSSLAALTLLLAAAGWLFLSRGGGAPA